MSATATTTPVVITTVRNKERMSLLLQAKRASRLVQDKIYAFGHGALSWAQDAFGGNRYVQAAARKVGPASSALMSAARRSKIGIAVGILLLGISTERGRKVIEFVTRPVRAAGKFLYGSWIKTENALVVDEPVSVLDRIRNKVAHGLTNVREFLESAFVKVAVKVAPHTGLDTTAMRLARYAGEFILFASVDSKLRNAHKAGVVGAREAEYFLVAVTFLQVLIRNAKASGKVKVEAEKAARSTMKTGEKAADEVKAEIKVETAAAEATKPAPAGNRKARRSAAHAKQSNASKIRV